MGAWIEIRYSSPISPLRFVAPHMGAWIEINLTCEKSKTWRSHPTWVRGLKYCSLRFCSECFCRTPHGCVDWNYFDAITSELGLSRTPHGCVDWNTCNGFFIFCDDVAPHMGAWIEIINDWISSRTDLVAPHMGAWIEIGIALIRSVRCAVAPHMGAWIEIVWYC